VGPVEMLRDKKNTIHRVIPLIETPSRRYPAARN